MPKHLYLKSVCKGILSHIVSLKERYQVYKFHLLKEFQQGFWLWVRWLKLYGFNSWTSHVSGFCCVILDPFVTFDVRVRFPFAVWATLGPTMQSPWYCLLIQQGAWWCHAWRLVATTWSGSPHCIGRIFEALLWNLHDTACWSSRGRDGAMHGDWWQRRGLKAHIA